MEYDYLIVGAGLSGCVMAERLASGSNKKVLIVEKRPHIGGNVYDYIDSQTNIRVSKYGPHIFHTNKKHVWDYITSFATKWERYDHRTLSYVDGKFLNIPVNINTINQVYHDENIQNTDEMITFMDKIKASSLIAPINSEEIALERVGQLLYERLFRPYTIKQWAKDPTLLAPDVLSRIPVHMDFDDRYFKDKWQALPADGYTGFIENLLDNSNIKLLLNTDYFDFIRTYPINIKEKTIFTGPIDHFYDSIGFPPLEYRSLDFQFERYYMAGGFYQPSAVVNYPDLNVPYTRITEYKHFLNQKSPYTIIAKETSTSEGEPFYPVLNDKNITLYQKYREMADKDSSVLFLGRCATFRYINMDEAIDLALAAYKNIKEK